MKSPESSSTDVRDPISGLRLADTPVLIFEVDAAGIDQAAAPARRCDMRLVGRTREVPGDQLRDSPGDQLPNSPKANLSAVLVFRALTPSRLRSCIRAVTIGGASMPPERLCLMLPERGSDAADALQRQLARRELDVLRLLADGESTSDIALRLSYSERTVKNIVHDLLVKLDCRTRAHAVALAARHGMI